MRYKITIVVDTNDADYNTKVSLISEKDLEKIKPLIKAIKAFKPYSSYSKGSSKMKWDHEHNYPHGEYSPRTDLGEKTPEEIYPQFSEEIHEIFRDHCPFGEHGFHTIVSVKVAPAIKEQKLL